MFPGMDMKRQGYQLGMRLLLAISIGLLAALGSCNKQHQAATENADTALASATPPAAEENAASDIILPEDTEVTLVVDYKGWDVNSDTGSVADREHVFSVSATWGINLHQELREIVVREGQQQATTLDIGGGQELSISPQWHEHQKGSYLFKVEDRASGKVIAAFDARDTDELASMTDPRRYGHHTKTVLSNLDKRVFLQEVKLGGPGDFSRESEFGMAYVGEGFKDMPVCKVNDNHHWHFPRFEVVACPQEWMERYSFRGLGEKLISAKGGVAAEGGGIIAVDWDKLYTAQKRAQRSCSTGGG